MENKPGVLILIGMMGSGKTTVGELLAGRLSRSLWDTDRMIEEAAEKSISAIFADDGEEVFRKLETKTLEGILEADVKEMILSVGGGLPVRSENRALLKQIGTVIYLKTSAKEAAKRLSTDATRPLLAGGESVVSGKSVVTGGAAGKEIPAVIAEKEERIRKLLAERASLYEAAADLIVSTDGRTPAQVAEEILRRIQK